MRAAVRAAFVAFTEAFEGDVATMYPDVKGLITVGIGNLIDPVGTAVVLPFERADGSPATHSEIAAEWQRMHDDRVELGRLGWKAAAKIATLHLSAEGIAQLVAGKLEANDHYLEEMKGRFPDFSTFPAAAQLGILSMAWACGPAFEFPLFQAAVHARDWLGAAAHTHMEDSHNAGLRPRNAADVLLFDEAAAVQAAGADFDVLWYPAKFAAEIPVVTDDDRPVFALDEEPPPTKPEGL